MPCTERFDAQQWEYREDVLPDVSNREILRVSIEAGASLGGNATRVFTACASASTGSASRRPHRTRTTISG